ncbi:DUF1611 domain-containing protein [Candidatus Sumerlaeota bacterium]|nr:DUF1611 domain-containing protein [Candidatus Sumerlaeota bacterium]
MSTASPDIIPASPIGPEMFGPARRLALLADGRFNHLNAKTSFGVLRFAPNPVVAVIDGQHAGQTVHEVTGIDRDTPIVATAEEAIALGAEVLVIGIAPKGGILPAAWRQMLVTCLQGGVDVAAGLHTFLGEDPDFRAAADANGRRIFDVRRPPAGIGVAGGKCRHLEGKRIVLCAGTDCCVGKKTTGLALEAELKRRGVRAKFVPTGQTGIFCCGWGIAIDRMIADFTAGAMERLVLAAAEEADVILVEGQGSLLHPGYSGVTLSFIHGTMPSHMVLTVPSTPVDIEDEYGLEMPPLTDIIELHEHIMRHIRPLRTVGIALNSYTVSEAEARRQIDRFGRETGLPVDDVIRFGAGAMADALMG